MKQKCSEAHTFGWHGSKSVFGYVKIQMGPGSQCGAIEFPPSSLGVLHVSPNTGPGLLDFLVYVCFLVDYLAFYPP